MADKTNFFPHLPPYEPPKTGWLCRIPTSWLPYFQLMRWDRPHGFWYFWLPHVYGTVHAGILLHSAPSQLLKTNLILFFGTWALRGATCTWNDTVDADFDRKVARTRNRAIARGAVSTSAANVFTLVQSVIAAGFLRLLPPPCFVYAIPSIIGWIAYPLAKRVTNYPQVVLGFPMAMSIFMGEVAIGAEPFLGTSDLNQCEIGAICCLYAANVAWTLGYEIIHSHQDLQDDIKAGVGNIVILIQGHAKMVLAQLALVQVILLAATGWLTGAGPIYYTGTVVGSSLMLALIIGSVKLEEPENCWWWFKNGSMLTGLAMLSGLVGEYIMKVIL